MRLFEALLELLDMLGEERAVVLVIEDFHWADRSTRAFATFLARNLRHERVLFMFSYRDEELHRRHPLRALLSELDRGGRTRRIAIGPWAREELDEALADILGAPPRAELVARLYARAEGNPLYTEELLAAGMDGRGAAPQSLRDAFILRIEQLLKDARQALRVLAVAGRADEALIAQVAALDAETLTGGAPRSGLAARDRGGLGRALRVPSRAAARGRIRGSAAGRALRAAPRARACARRATARGRRAHRAARDADRDARAGSGRQLARTVRCAGGGSWRVSDPRAR